MSYNYWDSDSPEFKAIIEEIDHFDARGMRHVFGRRDCFVKYRAFHMDIWLNKSEKLFMRFWARSRYVSSLSFKISGVEVSIIPAKKLHLVCDDYWIPKSVRHAYNDWLEDMLEYPDYD